jgi:hypothetical protein
MHKDQFAIATRAAATIASAIAALALAAPALANDASARTIVDAVAARTTTVSSYTANISLHVAMHSFPFVRLTISGDTAYQQPGQYSVKMHTLPALAKAFQNVSGDAGDPTVWVRKYDIAVDARAQAQQGQIALRLTQRTRGQIDHAEAFVDIATMTVARMEWFYNNGGHIAIDYHYAPIGSIMMVDRQTAEISMPSIRASATAELSNYALQTDLAVTTPSRKAASQ